MELKYDLADRCGGSAGCGARGPGRLTGKVNAILAAFEPEGTAAAEKLEALLEAAHGRLEVFARKVAEDASQYTLGLVKSHYPEADLEPVGDGMAPDTSDLP